MAGLTEKQRRFCEEYVIDWNGTRAAIAAGYSKATAKEQASQNLTKLNIQEYIEELKQSTLELLGLSRLRVVKELMNVGFSSPSDLRKGWKELKEWEELTEEQKASIAEISHYEMNIGEDAIKEVMKIKQYDKLKALAMLCKMFGWDEPQKEDKGQFNGTLVVQIGQQGIPKMPSSESEIVDFMEDE